MSNFFSLTESSKLFFQATWWSSKLVRLNFLSSFQVICFLRRASENYTTEASTFSEELQGPEPYTVKMEGKLENYPWCKKTLGWDAHPCGACIGSSHAQAALRSTHDRIHCVACPHKLLHSRVAHQANLSGGCCRARRNGDTWGSGCNTRRELGRWDPQTITTTFLLLEPHGGCEGFSPAGVHMGGDATRTGRRF